MGLLIAFMDWQIKVLPYIFAFSIFLGSLFAAVGAYLWLEDFKDAHSRR